MKKRIYRIGLIGVMSFILFLSLFTYSHASQLLATHSIDSGFGGARTSELYQATAEDISFYMAYGLTQWYGAPPIPVASQLLITGPYKNNVDVQFVFDSNYLGFTDFVNHLMNGIGEELMFQYSLHVTGPQNPYPIWGGGNGSTQENWAFDPPYMPTVDFKDYASSIDSIKLYMHASWSLNNDYWENGEQYFQGLLDVNSTGRWEVWGTPLSTEPPTNGVPEPTTMLLLGLGLAGLAGLRRKMK